MITKIKQFNAMKQTYKTINSRSDTVNIYITFFMKYSKGMNEKNAHVITSKITDSQLNY